MGKPGDPYLTSFVEALRAGESRSIAQTMSDFPEIEDTDQLTDFLGSPWPHGKPSTFLRQDWYTRAIQERGDDD